MTEHEEFIKMMYDRAKKTDEELDEIEVGTPEYKSGVESLTKIGDILNDNQQQEIDREDKEARREEQQRVNNEELGIKKTQIVNETNRLEMDRESRKGQLKVEFGRILNDGLANFARLALWGRFTTIAMNEEYNLNGSRNIPIGIQRSIDRTPPKKL